MKKPQPSAEDILLCASGKGTTQIANGSNNAANLEPNRLLPCEKVCRPATSRQQTRQMDNETVSAFGARRPIWGAYRKLPDYKEVLQVRRKLGMTLENLGDLENTLADHRGKRVPDCSEYSQGAVAILPRWVKWFMFSALYCAEYGGKMYQRRATNFAENQKYFICSTPPQG